MDVNENENCAKESDVETFCGQEISGTVGRRLALKTRAFLIDYCQRHAHPVNAGLHIVGVPMVVLGAGKLIAG